MYGIVIFLLCGMLIDGQGSNNKQDALIAKLTQGRMVSVTFDSQFSRGRCPRHFYQVGDECLFFANDGKSSAWKAVEKKCSNRIPTLLNDPPSVNPDQPNMEPTRGVRQLVLNTPEKTEILRAFNRDYQEQNFAVRLPSDYTTLRRCRDGQDDKWPEFCSGSQYTNATCFEAISNGANDICLRDVDCNAKNSVRLACEFTLPGSPEVTSSKFRNCPETSGRRGRLPVWAWVAIGIGSALLLLIILGVVCLLIVCLLSVKRRKTVKVPIGKPYPEPRHTPETTLRVPAKREDPAAQPMLTRAGRRDEPDTGYLQSRVPPTDNTANA